MNPNDLSSNPYRPPEAALEVNTATAGHFELAERGTRLGAVLLDSVVAIVAMAPGFILMGIGGEGSALGMVGIGLIGIAGLGLFVTQVMFLVKYAQSIGKRMLKIQIRRSSGHDVNFGRIFGLRMVVPGLIGAIPVIGSIFSLVNVVFIFREDRRCLHDLIADTVVVKADPSLYS